MNLTFKKTPGLVLLCKLDGEIIQVLQNHLGFGEHIETGRLLSAVVERESFGKTLHFLLELRTWGSAFDWQLNLALNNKVIPLNFAGVVFDDHLVILAAKDHNGMMTLYEELMQISNEQTNHIRTLLKERAASGKEHTDRDMIYYDELTRLYNELANLQREVAKKNVQLERLNAQKNRFLGMAAHDLRNPLNAILMYSEFLLEEVADSLSEEHQNFLSVIRSSSQFMVHLVEDFLDISTIESGKLHVELWPVDLAELVRNNIALNSILAARKNIRLRPAWHDTYPEILVDAGKIEQVLNNLIGNAIKFSAPGSTITVDIVQTPDQLILSVADQGPGIPEHEVEGMFEPFERTSVKSSSGEKSSGLGLAIARKIVLEHGGRLWAESVIGAGSCFYVALPRAKPESEMSDTKTDMSGRNT